MDRVGVQIGRIARQRPPQSPGSTSAAREREPASSYPEPATAEPRGIYPRAYIETTCDGRRNWRQKAPAKRELQTAKKEPRGECGLARMQPKRGSRRRPQTRRKARTRSPGATGEPASRQSPTRHRSRLTEPPEMPPGGKQAEPPSPDRQTPAPGTSARSSGSRHRGWPGPTQRRQGGTVRAQEPAERHQCPRLARSPLTAPVGRHRGWPGPTQRRQGGTVRAKSQRRGTNAPAWPDRH